MLKVRSARPVICLTLTNLGTVPWPSPESFSGLKAGSIMLCSSLQLLFCSCFEAPGYSIFRSKDDLKKKKLLLSTSGLECNPGFDLWVDGCFLPCPIGEYRYGYTCEKCYANCNVARLSLRSMGSQFLAAKGWMYCHLLPICCQWSALNQIISGVLAQQTTLKWDELFEGAGGSLEVGFASLPRSEDVEKGSEQYIILPLF